MNFLADFHLLSFWFGFILGAVFLLLLTRAQPIIKKFIITLGEMMRDFRKNLQADLEVQFKNDILEIAQNYHIASPLFALDEILVPPRILAPPPRIDPSEEEPIGMDIVNTLLPYMPDYPELATTFGAPTISLARAMSNGANIALMGEAGSGKSVALAHFAIQIARGEVEYFAEYLPVLVHVGDLELTEVTDPIQPLADAFTSTASRKLQGKVFDVLETVFKDERAVLLLDGTDELPPDQVALVEAYLQTLRISYPNIRLAVAVSIDHIGKILSPNLFPMVLTAWDARQKEQLLQKWAIHWERHVQTDGEQTEAISGIILNRWLTDKTTFSPLELVLRTWSAYAGDALGPTLGDALDAYLRRMTVDIDGGITALERFAIGSVQNLAPTPTEDTASIWINNPIYHENMSSDAPLPKVGRDTLDKLVESGLVIRNHLEQYRLSHPAITGYLAGHLWQYGANPDELIEQPDWCGKYLTLASLAQNTDIIDQVDFLVNPDDPMKSGLMHMGRWLRNTNPQYRWRQEVMKQLLRVWQDTRFSFGLRARACAALFLSGDPTVRNLLKKTMTAADVVIQSLSVLGLGFLGETGAAIRLAEFLKPAEDMKTRQAACLALAQLGTQRAVNTVVTALLDGDEELQHAAAVSLSYHVSEGHKLLQEAVEDEDFMVRRAATIGIGRINESWAQELLTEIVIKESQWVVRNSAEQALVAFQDSSPYIPIPYPEPHQIPWLIEFAGQRGRGVAPGDPAIETMFTALEDNNPRVKQAAMQFLTLYEKNTIHIEMYRTYFRSRGMVQDASMNMLWHLQRVGIELPPPLQFGFDDMVR